jgi:hypothetical protein
MGRRVGLGRGEAGRCAGGARAGLGCGRLRVRREKGGRAGGVGWFWAQSELAVMLVFVV